MHWRLAVGAAGMILAAVALTTAAAYVATRPKTLRIALLSDDGIDRTVLSAVASQLETRRAPIRIKLVLMDEPGQPAQAMDRGEVDMAIARSDSDNPASARAVLVMRNVAAIFLASTKSNVTKLSQLPGHRVGYVPDIPGQHQLLDLLLNYFGMKRESLTFVQLPMNGVSLAFKDGRIDAAVILGPTNSHALARSFGTIDRTLQGKLRFIDLPNNDSIAALREGLISTTIPEGAFSGRPLWPPEEISTVGYVVRLMATDGLDEGIVANFVRLVLAMKPSLAAAHSTAAGIAPPDPDDDKGLVLQAGVKAYLDGDDTSLVNRYSDYFYLGASLISGLVSVVALSFGSFANRRRRQTLAQLFSIQDLAAMVPEAESLESLVEIDRKTSAVAHEAFHMAAQGELKADDIAAFGLALTDLRSSIAMKRTLLSAAGKE